MANTVKIGNQSFSVGDLVKIHQKIIESGKERISVFQGMIIAVRGEGENKSFTVRKICSGGIGVERIWPLNTPWIVKTELVKKGQTRRAKLYYLRKRSGKGASKVKSKEIKPANGKKKPRQTGRGSRSKTAEK